MANKFEGVKYFDEEIYPQVEEVCTKGGGDKLYSIFIVQNSRFVELADVKIIRSGLHGDYKLIQNGDDISKFF